MTVVARRRLAWRGARRTLSFMLGLALLAVAASHASPTSWEPRDTTVVSVAAAAPAAQVDAPAQTSEPPVATPVTEIVRPEPVALQVTALTAQRSVAVSGPRAPPARSA
jgi:hypothetical protein